MNAEHAEPAEYFSELSGLSVPRVSDEGFSILEVLVATTVLTVGLVAMAQLFAISAKANGGARATTFAVVLAGQKLEHLRGLTWGFDLAGAPVSDADLNPSPAGTLQDNVDGYVEYLDGSGNAAVGPGGAIYIRRWSIEPLPTDPNNTLVFQVLVTRRIAGDDVRVVSVKTRKQG